MVVHHNVLQVEEGDGLKRWQEWPTTHLHPTMCDLLLALAALLIGSIGLRRVSGEANAVWLHQEVWAAALEEVDDSLDPGGNPLRCALHDRIHETVVLRRLTHRPIKEVGTGLFEEILGFLWGPSQFHPLKRQWSLRVDPLLVRG
eukprot:CAMPEP_0115484054 /NCGR_PEP_ID=MMETSP0271-20121206/59179_1 /TAXON_ID=71861 /ORGANISM="Scrippsiella trochoidea, Strain CCMP3099" /LENGTH=144 /DNA_ID=CAMNT_0002911935 /DNA_START=178 /DNA_END=612 /DNA_ORIENTATION=+